jgi:hypothetical protein
MGEVRTAKRNKIPIGKPEGNNQQEYMRIDKKIIL